MKKLILPAACLVLLASCKKDYTCDCQTTETWVSPSLNEMYVTSDNTVYKGVNKKFVQDKAECYSTQSSYIEYDYPVSISWTGTVYEDVTVTTTRDCSISK